MYYRYTWIDTWYVPLVIVGLIIWVGGVGYRFLSIAREARNRPPSVRVIREKMLTMPPVSAIEELMLDIEQQGYVVERTKALQPDSLDRAAVLVQYRVTSSDGDELWLYGWELRAPEGLLFGRDEDRILDRLDECTLTPLTAAAKQGHDELELHKVEPESADT